LPGKITAAKIIIFELGKKGRSTAWILASMIRTSDTGAVPYAMNPVIRLSRK